MGRTRNYLFLALLMLAGVAAIAFFENHLAEEFTTCMRVVDGDTLRLCDRDERIRLRGIDAPELAQDCQAGSKTYACGRKARDFLRQLIGKRDVTCRTTGEDQYGRLLAICEINGLDIGQTMVTNGWAVSLGGYLKEENQARRQGKGLWSGTFLMPREWRDQAPKNH